MTNEVQVNNNKTKRHVNNASRAEASTTTIGTIQRQHHHFFAPLRQIASLPFFAPRESIYIKNNATMGVHPQSQTKKKKKSTVDRFGSGPKRVQATLDDWVVCDDDDYVDEPMSKKGRVSRHSKTPKASTRWPRQRYEPAAESDDDEVMPVKLEKIMASKAAKQSPEATSRQKRKRTSGTSSPSGLFEGLVRPVNRRAEREANYSAVQPMKSKRARRSLGVDEVDEAALTPPSTARRGPRFVPLPDHPLPSPQWTLPAPKPSTIFALPAFSLNLNDARPATAVKTTTSGQTEQRNQKQGPTKRRSKVEPTNDQNAPTTPPSEPRYAEIEEFDFKLIVSHSNQSGTATEYYNSSDLAGNMKAFWPLVRKLRGEWEDAAGAEWAWELQKTQKSRGKRQGAKRFCVSSKVAKKPTLWRKGDVGNFACRKCAANSSLCFTWVADEDVEFHQDESVVPEPKGEFWCLPIHPEDRRCLVTKDREIRTWLNEGDNSESDSSGEDDGVSSDEDEYKVECDFDQLSLSESSSSEDSNGDESTDNEGL